MSDNGDRSGKLTPRQAKAIPALLSHRTVDQAAEAVGISPRTISRWLADDSFRAALVQAEGEAISEATRKLLYLADPAISVIGQTMADKSNSAAVRLRAAQAVLDYLLRLRELRNVEARLAELEAAVYGKPKQTTD